MNGFPACQKEIRIKFHVINALYNKGIESVTVKATGSSQGLLSEVTDAGGFATIGPFVPGESITVKVSNNGFDDVDRVFTADEAVTYMMLGMNPTGPDLRLILTWGPSPSDLDAQVKFFDSDGNEECKLYWNNKKCGDYASLDVDNTNGGENGPETITIKEIPDGLTAMYYVYDFSNKIGRTMSWSDSESKSTIFSPSGGGSTVVPYDSSAMNGERYFVVGCFGNAGYSDFRNVAKAANSISFTDCQ